MNRPTIRFEGDVITLNHMGWQRNEGGLLNLSSLLLGNCVIIICTEKYEHNIEFVYTSPRNFLAATTDSSFISSGQENYSND